MNNTPGIGRVKSNVSKIVPEAIVRPVGVSWKNQKIKSLDKTKPANFGEGAGFESSTGMIMTQVDQKSNRGGL